MKLRRLLPAITVIILAVLLVLTGCGKAASTISGPPPASSPDSPDPASPAATGTAAASFPLTITDDIGRQVVFNRSPQRIISLAPSNTELVYAIGADDRLIGVTTYCDYPPQVKDKPEVSEFSQVDVEKLVSLNPDLVLAADIHKTDVVPALEKLNIPVLVIRPGTIDGVFHDLEWLGQVTGNTQQAAALTVSLQQRVTAVTQTVQSLTDPTQPRILYVTWQDPLWTAGDDTMIGDLIHKAGAVNIASDLSGYATLTLEQVVARNPQIILVMAAMGDQDTTYQYIINETHLQATDALKNRQVYSIDPNIFGRTTPRIVDGLETLAKIVHPEAFK